MSSDNPLPLYAWEKAEASCFQYLIGRLAAQENVVGYLAEFPRTLPDNATDVQMWMFAMNGAGPVPVIQNRESVKPWSSWTMGAIFRGIFTDRTTAQRVAGRIFDALPVDAGTLNGVARFTIDGMPSLERDVIQLAPDLSTGGETRVWKLEIPMYVVFFNT